MAGLKAPPPLVARIAPSVNYLGSGEEIQDRDAARRSMAGVSLRRLYNTARWRHKVKGLRVEILTRDGFACRFCKVPLIGGRDAPDSAVVDHIKPHEGNLALFWDRGNLQALCKKCHDGEKQTQDKAAQRGGGWV